MEHLVFVRFIPGAADHEIEAFSSRFSSLQTAITLVRNFRCVLNISPENKDPGFRHLYKMHFADSRDRNEYLVHPEHVKFTEFAAACGIIGEVMVFDHA